jgi:oxamate amidohydrolase
MVTTPHWRATEAGTAVLRRGGTAIEALVAAGSVLSVVYPHFCGLGGDAVWMVSDQAGKTWSFLGIGQAAINTDSKHNIPLRGAGSMLTTACLVDSWDKVLTYSALEWGGALPLNSLLEDAIAVADNGFAVSRSQTFWYDFRADEHQSWAGFQKSFQREGLQHQPALARTLDAIATQGARDFYEGGLAQRIAKGLADVGSPLTEVDLKKTQTVAADPVQLTYRDTILLAPPPPTQGLTTLGIMGVLNHLLMAEKAIDSADFYHALVEAVKQAFLDRKQIADPAFGKDVSADLLDPSRLAFKAASINFGQALPWPHIHQQGDTAFLGAVDNQGRCASLLQSLYFDWGSGIVVGDTGILWQNRGAAFSADVASPNCVQPGKRPFYTLNPGLALKAGRPHLIYGTQGADGQPQTLALLLSLLIDHKLDPLQALSRPRFLLGQTFSDSRDSLKLEKGLDGKTVDAIAALGHEISTIDAFSPIAGQAGIIRISADGQINGAHDPRSDGGALGL